MTEESGYFKLRRNCLTQRISKKRSEGIREELYGMVLFECCRMLRSVQQSLQPDKPFVTVCAKARGYAIDTGSTNRAKPLRGAGLPVKRMFSGRFAQGDAIA